MVQAHRVICPVQDKKVRIDLPADFPDAGEVEVIVLPLSPAQGARSDMATGEWLRDLWACVPDFPDRSADLPPEPVAIP
jgi:hypothetical protein